jgi:hypothetical protein
MLLLPSLNGIQNHNDDTVIRRMESTRIDNEILLMLSIDSTTPLVFGIGSHQETRMHRSQLSPRPSSTVDEGRQRRERLMSIIEEALSITSEDI